MIALQFLGAHWLGLLIFVVIVIVAAVAIKFGYSDSVTGLREWLKYAVTIAEQALGSGTGQLKLRMVYDMFVGKFTWLAKFFTFDSFSSYVDEALIWLRSQLSSNKAVADFVSSDEGSSSTSSITFHINYDDDNDEEDDLR